MEEEEEGAAQKRRDENGAATTPSGPAPINFFYGHLHNSIRAELDDLAQSVLALEAGAGEGEQMQQERLSSLKARYHFLEQVYKYHSSVEDEVGVICFAASWCCCAPERGGEGGGGGDARRRRRRAHAHATKNKKRSCTRRSTPRCAT